MQRPYKMIEKIVFLKNTDITIFVCSITSIYSVTLLEGIFKAHKDHDEQAYF